MRKTSSKRKTKKTRRVLPVVLISLAAGSLITLAVVYTPSWFQVEYVAPLSVTFQFNDSTPPPDTVLIEVWNGAGVPDLAMRAQNFLETRGGEVTFYAPGPPLNAEGMNYGITIVVSHDTSFSAAMKVAEIIGVGDSSIVMMLPAPGQIAPVDVTIILGRDRDDPSVFIPYRD